MISEIDELAETIMDCIMNSHVISDEGVKYVESFLPTKPSGQASLCIELFEKVDRDRSQKVALIFKTHAEAKKWYYQFRQQSQMQNKINKKAMIVDNVLFKYADLGKSLFSYVEYICEFIDQQPVCVLQHNISDQDLRLTETYHFYYKIHWKYKGFLPNTSPVLKSEAQVRNSDRVKVDDASTIKVKQDEAPLLNQGFQMFTQQPRIPQPSHLKKKEKELMKQQALTQYQDPEESPASNQFDADFDGEYDYDEE